MPDTFGDQYDFSTFIRRVHSTREPSIKRAQVARHFRTVNAEVVAEHLQIVLGATSRGQTTALEVMFAIIDHLSAEDPADIAIIDHIDLVARKKGYWSVVWILLMPLPHKTAESLRTAQRHKRVLTLGERRAFAAGWKPHMLERLLRDNDPRVVARLCKNPKITQEHVISMATRRPTMPVLLGELLKHPKWLRTISVREAVAHNPFASTAVSLQLIPTFTIDIIHRLKYSTDLHPFISLACDHFIALRDGKILPLPNLPKFERKQKLFSLKQMEIGKGCDL